MSHQTARNATQLVKALQAEGRSQDEINHALLAFLDATERQQKGGPRK